MQPRNPELEVYEAGLLVLKHGKAKFISDMILLADKDRMNAGIIYSILKKQTSVDIPEVPGFRLANTMYDDRLLAAWMEFFTAVAHRDKVIHQTYG